MNSAHLSKFSSVSFTPLSKTALILIFLKLSSCNFFIPSKISGNRSCPVIFLKVSLSKLSILILIPSNPLSLIFSLFDPGGSHL